MKRGVSKDQKNNTAEKHAFKEAPPSPVIRLNGVQIIYPAIYEAHEFGDELPAKFSVGCSVTEDHVRLLNNLGVVGHPETGLFYFRSSHAPRVSVGGNTVSAYEELVKAFQIADARNIGRDKLFRDITANIDIRLFDYNVNINWSRYKGTGGAILEIWVDPYEIFSAAVRPA